MKSRKDSANRVSIERLTRLLDQVDDATLATILPRHPAEVQTAARSALKPERLPLFQPAAVPPLPRAHQKKPAESEAGQVIPPGLALLLVELQAVIDFDQDEPWALRALDKVSKTVGTLRFGGSRGPQTPKKS